MLDESRRTWQLLARGQLFEFRIWSELIAQSRGALHVFLPLLDRGIDGVVHRVHDGAYTAIQCKSRSALEQGSVKVVVPVESLVDDEEWIVAGLNDPDAGIGPLLLVVPVAEFKARAAHGQSRVREWYEASFPMHPHDAKWEHWLIPREALASAFLEGMSPAPVAPLVEEPLAPADRERQWLGFVGESEVIRRLAESPELDLFRPFPDLETVELVCRDNRGPTSRWCGLQVKTGAVAGAVDPRVHVSIRRLPFHPSPSTFVVVLAWLPEDRAIHPECLLIPSTELDRVASIDGLALMVEWRPASRYPTILDPYRVRLAELGGLVLDRCA
ncbi:MAG TPA: hypothetical protein VF134_07935 [Candidatus Dormibacteraeota bacterium]